MYNVIVRQVDVIYHAFNDNSHNLNTLLSVRMYI